MGGKETAPFNIEDHKSHELCPGIISLDVIADAVNDTQDPLSNYVVAEMDGNSLLVRGDEPTRCQSCGHLFTGPKAWSALFAHQGKICVPADAPQEPHPVRVSFASTRATDYVKEVLASLHLDLEVL